MDPTTAAITEVATTAVWAAAVLAAARLYLRTLAARPRWCSCGHGPGPHGPNGCTGRVPFDGYRQVADCRCTGFDAAGKRAPL